MKSKTHSGAKKRMKLLPSGKVKRKQPALARGENEAEADADRAWAAADPDPATLGRHVFREDA